MISFLATDLFFIILVGKCESTYHRIEAASEHDVTLDVIDGVLARNQLRAHATLHVKDTTGDCVVGRLNINNKQVDC